MSKVVLFGTPAYVIPIPEALLAADHKVVAVVTQPPKPVGRKQVITPSEVSLWAQEKRIKVLDSEPLQLTEVLKALNADVGILAAYGRIIPPEILKIFPHGMLNIHPSLLPKYRGASPIQAAILAGDKETGVTIIKMDEKVDHGPIVSQKVIGISGRDTSESLRTRAFQLGAEILIEILPDYLSGKITPEEQDHSKTTYTWTVKESKEKAYFDISNPPKGEALDRMIRAFYPWPVAWTKWQGKVIKLFPNKKIQIEGKNPVRYEEFKKAYPDFPLSGM